MRRHALDFEKPIAEVEANIASLKQITEGIGEDRTEEIRELELLLEHITREIFSNLSAWDKVQMARHELRPYTMDYVRLIFDDFVEIHEDRHFGDDPAMVGGMATLDGERVMVIGHQKGRDAKERAYRNFGSAKPEGYRKALRLAQMAEKFRRPLLCFVDTPAADCTVEAEERGISESIARNMRDFALLKIPTMSIVIGEGGSGGAVGIATTNRVAMLEHSIYSIIPPEGCAAILWRDPDRAPEAAEALKLTAEHALRFGVVDEVIEEPMGGAHRNYDETARRVKASIQRHLSELKGLSGGDLVQSRYERFRRLGEWYEEGRASIAVAGG
ncbi:MAG: acetyl-CoA carboxylase carboxyltransferase subunit alpha [Armatimonadetes bacterium]|nr:acetyl-CoA carboxylase carboxyltransferase subunit alpha [Armatimonadota bacterium]